MEAGCDGTEPDPCGPVRERVEAALAEFMDARLRGLEDETAAAVFGTARDFVLSGGKRIRPLLCYWGWRGANGGDCAEILKAAAALEIFHAFCLIHDDIMDDSDLRRGRPSLHRTLAGLHASRRWRGDARQFGIATAILLGDLCMTWADELLHTSGLPRRRLASARRYYHRMRSELCYGQHLDILEQARGPSSTERSLDVVRYKTAKYTVERPLHLGGALAGAPPGLLAAYSAFGLALGEAFQLRDDLLGAFGDPAVTGKPNLDDLRSGKPTVLVAHAVRHAAPAERRLLDRLLGDPRLGEDGADLLRRVLRDTGARAATESMITERGERARAALAEAPIEPCARRALAGLIGPAIHRTA
ncbi:MULTISPECIES: polyprenyl synthetase family protein [Actinomadura]|uniref:Polyprenyl synthetase family protein n=2 Tax=Actinomadura yumaensis TaxID=111807 RepID=A0ABW2CS97_9ACTN|nr:polyprenyl synthetase family protein [Actinomadura sp. J1-007]MWK37351.1 polyprenyl synthetase family protein [Actinomadura sp. J1-007]